MNDKYNDILNQLEDMIDDSEEVIQNSSEEVTSNDNKIKTALVKLTDNQKESLLKDVNDVIKNIEAILCQFPD